MNKYDLGQSISIYGRDYSETNWLITNELNLKKKTNRHISTKPGHECNHKFSTL
jgi:hypothetical protein